MRRRVRVEDKSRFSINDISLGEDLGANAAKPSLPFREQSPVPHQQVQVEPAMQTGIAYRGI